nr:vacuolar protein-sorting protein bro1-like [Tanacetum cinerariifolium]
MGKGEEHPLPTTITDSSQSTVTSSNNCCCSVFGLFRFRCVFVLILGLAVLLSAVFWLPIFQDHGDLDLDDVHYKGHDIVATFMIQKPLSLVQDDIPQLGGDIFDEIRVPTTKVVILTTENIPSSNTTKIVFGVDPVEHNSKISSYAKSLVRDSFVSLVLHQSPLRLTESLFGEPSSFEVLKFVGGITVTPDQSAYPLQKVQIRFNFTLNFSIEQILDHFDELTSQLKLGLHLGPYEPPPQSHHHHHHHHHHHDKHVPPAKPPSPNEKGRSKHSPASPPVPTPAPQKSCTAKPPDHHKKKNAYKHPPAPLPNVVFAGNRPPPKSDSDADPPDMTPSGSVLQPSSACAGAPLRAIPAFLVVILLHVLQQQ